MYVKCKKCGQSIEVSSRPKGSTNVEGNIGVKGNVDISGGSITFGPGGSISFGEGGSIGFGGAPLLSTFTCMNCGHTGDYAASEIHD